MDRRTALKATLLGASASVLPSRSLRAIGFRSANARPRIAAIGTGSRWYIRATGLDLPYGSAPEMKQFGDYTYVCDADANRCATAAGLVEQWTGVSPMQCKDYRQILDDASVDMVHISTPDHWHAKIAIEAMLAGKDVYCEKPMTLTIDEGKAMCRVCKATGRIVQIGTQQRSDISFLKAIALIRAGRIGQLKKVTCSIGGASTSPSIPEAAVPPHLDWNLWLGPAPETAYRQLPGDHGETKSWSRCHYEFRWWYEYSGGKLTDWGAHHVDIATWAMEKTTTGPVKIEPIHIKHPVDFRDGYPIDNSRYNTATEFQIEATFADGQLLEIRHDGDNGILFEGTQGKIFVNRGRVSGKAVDDLKSNPLPDKALESVYKNRPVTDHFRNFFEAATDRFEPISDVFSHHRALTTCHLAGIAARLGRTLTWNPQDEQIVDDAQANQFLVRENRAGFAIDLG